MKALLFIGPAILLTTQLAFGQVQKGDRLVGVQFADITIRSRTAYNAFTAQFTPSFGWLVSDKTVVGAGLPIFVSAQNADSPTSTTSLRVFQAGLTPFVRHYLTTTTTRPYIGAGLTYVYTAARTEFINQSSSSSESGVGYNLNAGVAFFLNRHVSLDIIGLYRGNFSSSHPADLLVGSIGNQLTSLGGNSFTLGLGLNIFLPKK